MSLKTYAQKSSAVRAAKKEFGEKWQEVAQVIEAAPGEWTYSMLPQAEINHNLAQSLKSEVALLESVAAHQAAPTETAPEVEEVHVAPTIEVPATPKLPFGDNKAIGAEIAAQYASEEDSEFDMDKGMAAADAQANATNVNESEGADPLRPRLSTAERPTKKVWHIADSMPGAKRKEVIEECVRQGIAYGTARTQYQHWFKCVNDSKAAPIATIKADGTIVGPSK